MKLNARSNSILVTGARGYIGGRLVRHLADRRKIGVLGASRLDMPPPVGWPNAVPLRKVDPLGDLAVATEALSDVTTVIHLAAASEGRSISEPDAALAETGTGTRRLIEASVAAGVRRFIFLSTIHVYGSPLQGRISETNLLRPIHPYAITHQVGEAFTLAAKDAGRIQGVVVRLSNAIGAPARIDVDRWTLLGNDLARQVVSTGEIAIRTPGQWRDFITMPDVCRGLEWIADAPAEALRDGIFNLGSGTTCRVEVIAARLAHVAKLALRRPIVLRILGSEEISSSNPPFSLSIDRMRNLGFMSSGLDSLDVELDETIRLLNNQI